MISSQASSWLTYQHHSQSCSLLLKVLCSLGFLFLHPGPFFTSPISTSFAFYLHSLSCELLRTRVFKIPSKHSELPNFRFPSISRYPLDMSAWMSNKYLDLPWLTLNFWCPSSKISLVLPKLPPCQLMATPFQMKKPRAWEVFVLGGFPYHIPSPVGHASSTSKIHLQSNNFPPFC